MTTPVAYTVQDAAASAGVSTDTIRRAIKSGDLIANYPTSRPVILRDELDAWLRASPTEAPKTA